MNADASVFCTMRHINFNVLDGVKYLIGGPTISARASVKMKKKKIEKPYDQNADKNG